MQFQRYSPGTPVSADIGVVAVLTTAKTADKAANTRPNVSPATVVSQ